MKALILVMSVLLTVACAACYPVVVAPGCQQQVNDCLRGCSASPVGQPYEYSPTSPIDTRSDCERHCHESCAQQWK
ncbi:MAG TPA: hypothetical protein PKH54_10425 [Myxococcota bacterium]|nr:hypothetical protein [Myxococcota bacterium]HOA12613.1 hypothetical protein [Myxococcota bacterium]HOD00352.1 hypothetical protein [Myxococcota bacterium]HOH76420.1 hypothetical protein [Myxococcota bacterium]HPV04459.1 hypothetical protein [Myxococcota bacterium]